MNVANMLRGIAATAIKSAVIDCSRSHKEQFSVYLQAAGTAFDLAIEGRTFTPSIDFVVTDATDADMGAFFDGELTTALGRAPVVGDIFQVGGTGDTTDDALEAAKGSATADGDIFQVSVVGADAVDYIANEGFVTLALMDEATTDFAILVEAMPYIRCRTFSTWTAALVNEIGLVY